MQTQPAILSNAEQYARIVWNAATRVQSLVTGARPGRVGLFWPLTMGNAKKLADARTVPVHIHAGVSVMAMSPARSVNNSAMSGAVILDVARSARNLVRLVRSSVPGSARTAANVHYPVLFPAIYCLVLRAVRKRLRADTNVLRSAARHAPQRNTVKIVRLTR